MSDRIRPPPEEHVNIPIIIVAATLFIGLAVLATQWAMLLVQNFMRLPPW